MMDVILNMLRLSVSLSGNGLDVQRPPARFCRSQGGPPRARATARMSDARSPRGILARDLIYERTRRMTGMLAQVQVGQKAILHDLEHGFELAVVAGEQPGLTITEILAHHIVMEDAAAEV